MIAAAARALRISRIGDLRSSSSGIMSLSKRPSMNAVCGNPETTRNRGHGSGSGYRQQRVKRVATGNHQNTRERRVKGG